MLMRLQAMMDQTTGLGGLFKYIDLFSGGMLSQVYDFCLGYYALYYCIDYDADVEL